MDSFLSQVAHEIIRSGRDFSELKIVLPSQRAIRFLKIELARKIQTAVQSPKIISITEFVSELSGLQALSSLQQIVQCYESYQTIVPQKDREGFEQFLHWAPILIQDFNDLCAHRVPQDEIFSYLTEVEQIKQWAQKDLQTPLTRNYIRFWKQMPALFLHFTDSLLSKKKGLMGMLFSEAVENISLYLEHTPNFHYLVGFNALTHSESILFQEIVSQKRGKILWDLDQFFYRDKEHASGHFIRSYFKNWKGLAGQHPEWLGSHYSNPKKVQCIGANASIQQVKYAARLAEQLIRRYPEERIALVLGDESYLIPTLSAFQSDFDQWNVTMGYPLKKTPVADLLVQWIDLHQCANENRLTLVAVEKFLQTASLGHFLSNQGVNSEELLTLAKKRNQAFITLDSLASWSSAKPWQSLFDEFSDPPDFLDRMLQVTIGMQQYFFENEKNWLFESYFYSVELLLQQLQVLLQEKPIVGSLPVLRVLLEGVLQNESLSFVGNATEGLQVMGLLETRLLDFDRIIVTHVNEGHLPGGKGGNSFLPFEVKKEFGIPTYQEKEAIFTYHFFRLLKRAKASYLLYDTSEEGLGGAAPSRFLHQLELFAPPEIQLEKKQLQTSIAQPITSSFTVQKSPSLLKKLYEVAEYGFSPSALALYLHDPIAFYEERILGIHSPKEAEETVSYRDQGTVLHAVLETLYTPFVGKNLTTHHCKQMQNQLTECLESHFGAIYGKGQNLQGKNHLVFQVMKHHCNRFLQEEIKRLSSGVTIEILALEAPFSISLALPTVDKPVRLRGVVDRIDRVNGQLRILDYKTGTVLPQSLSIKPDSINFEDSKSTIGFQVLTYAYQYLKQFPGQQITAGVIALKATQSFLPLQWGAKDAQVLDSENITPFEDYLKKLILEILNPSISFQKKNE